MAATPPIKIYRNGEYVASCHYFEDAAAIAAMTRGTVVRWRRGKILWREGQEEVNAEDSLDVAASVMRQRSLEE